MTPKQKIFLERLGFCPRCGSHDDVLCPNVIVERREVLESAVERFTGGVAVFGSDHILRFKDHTAHLQKE